MITKFIKVSVFLFLAVQAFSQPLEFEFSTSSTPAPGGVYEVDVSVSNFQELLSAQVGIYWDSTVMSIDTIPFVTTDLPDFNRSAISLPEDNQTVIRGKVKVSWASLSLVPQSVDDETLLFTMRFNLIGAPCDTTSLTLGAPQPPFLNIEVIHNDKDEIGAIANNFPIEIPGTNCGTPPPTGCMNGELELVFNNESAENGENVCFPFIVNNFNDIITFQSSYTWDASDLFLTEVRNVMLPGSSPISFQIDTLAGVATYVWFDNTGGNDPQTFANGSSLFEMCFDVIGPNGSTSTIQAAGNPTPIQISATGGVVETCIKPGTFTVSGGGSDVFTLVSNSVTATESEVCVDISANNFTDIVTSQFTVQWDNDILCYNRITNLNSDLPLFESLFNQDDDVLRLTWGSSGAPVSLADGTVLYTICYDVKPGNCNANVPINFIDDLTPIEIATEGDMVIPFNLNEGSVTILFDCPTGNELMITESISNVLCNGGSDGSIDLEISGGTAPYDCNWGSPITNDNCNQSNLIAGTYSVTVTDSAGNSASETISISQPNPIVINGSGGAGTISYTVSGGTPPYTEEFNPPISDLNNVPAGTYTLLVTDSNMCPQTRIFQVTQGGQPIIVNIISITPASCANDGMICIECIGGSGNFGSAVSDPPLTFDSNQNCFLNVGGGTYTIRCTDNTGESGTAIAVVNVNAPQLSASVTNIDPALCNGVGGSFDVDVSGGCPGFAIDVGLAGQAKTPYNENNTYNPGDYSLCVRDSRGSTVTINFNIPLIGSGPLNADVTDILDASCLSNGSATITVDGGCNPICTLTNTDTNDAFACNPGQPTSLPAGNYTVMVQDDLGAIDSESFTIESTGGGDPLEVTLEAQDAPCAGMDGSITFDVVGACGDVTCTIDIGSTGTFQPCTIVGGAIVAPAGTHTVTFRDDVTTVTRTIIVDNSENAVSVELNAVLDNGIDININGGQMPFNITWTYPDGTPQTTEDLTGLTQEGTYTVVVVDAIGCSGSLEVPFTPNGMTPLTLIVNENNISAATCGSLDNCDGEVTGSVVGGSPPYNVSITDQDGNSRMFSISESGPFVLENICGGSYSISVTDGANATVDFASAVIVPSPDPIVITEDQVDCADAGESNGSISVFVEGGNSGYVYNWSPVLPNAGPSNDNLDIGTYTLQVTDDNGCSTSITLSVDDCNMPTGEDCGESISVITPNNDGINDLFMINCAESGSNNVGIYDRYGRQVLNVSNYRNTWSGLDSDGQALPEGAYYWIYETNGQITKGTVTLLRD